MEINALLMGLTDNVDPMKPAKLKGNHHATKARIQLPLPLTR